MKYLLLLGLLFFSFNLFAQDTIVKKNGSEIASKIIEITPEIIKYKTFDNLGGPMYSVYISDIARIRFENGKIEYFSKETPKLEVPKTKDTLVDPRDGQVYKTIKIGKQVWMAENLNYGYYHSWCYDTLALNCKKFGRLYTYESANNACPAGWHLPSDEEWKKLEVELGMQNEVELTGWRGTSPGQGYLLKLGGESGFAAKFGGHMDYDGNIENGYHSYWYLNKNGYFWTSTKLSNNTKAYSREFSKRASIRREAVDIKLAYSVRCVQGEI